MEVSKNELAALTRFFSPSVFKDLARTGRSPLLARLLRQTSVMSLVDAGNVLSDTFEDAFRLLRTLGHRDEYIYRSAIAQKIVIGKHKLNAAMLTEVRAGASKADVVVLNGTATAYEIKSERDSFARLTKQVENYRRVFAAVNIITSPSQAELVLDLVPPDVGVSQLSKDYTIQSLRDAQAQPWRTSPSAILDSLRANEASRVLKNLGVDIPTVPNTQLRRALRELFEAQDAELVHREMVQVLRSSRSQKTIKDFVETLPRPLQAAALGSTTTLAEQRRMQGALGTPLPTVLAWT